MLRRGMYRELCRSFRSRVSISYISLISRPFLLLLVISICVQSGFHAIEVPDSNIRTLLKAQSTDIVKDGQYRNSISFEESSSYDHDNKVNVTYFGRTLSITHNQDKNDTIENGRYKDRDCYRRIAMGKQLVAPTVTESFENTRDDLKCRETCENYKFKCIGYSFGFVEGSEDKSNNGLCDILAHSEEFSNPNTWTMRVVAGGKRFVVFQRNMNCMNEGIGKTEEEASEENNNIIPNRKILTGNKNMEKNTKPSNNKMVENVKEKDMSSRMREPRNFFVSVTSSTNDKFSASPLDISQYSANSILDKKLSFTPKQEPNLHPEATHKIISWSKPPKSNNNPYPVKSYKSSFLPSVNAPVVFSASASIEHLPNEFESNPNPTKNLGLTVTYVHSPSSQSSIYEKSACFRLEIMGKKIANNLVSKSWTAYTLEECLHYCVRELSFPCLGFSYRRHNDQSDVLNCDLTDSNTTSLDQYNPRHFVQNTITDVYQLYYKNDGSLYCDNLRDAGNKKLIMFIKPNSDSRNENNGLNHSMTIYEKNLDVTTENSVELQNYGKACFRRRRIGYRHRHETFRNQCSVNSALSLEDCSTKCREDLQCQSFSYRFDGAENWSSDISGNCILSTFEVNPSDQRKVIANDKDWDLYNYDRSSQTCGNRNFSPNLSTKRDCYIKTNRVGYKFFVSESRLEYLVRDERQCGEECSRQFNCKSFAFRERSLRDQTESRINCQLSNLPTSSLVSSDVEYVPNWTIYNKLDSKECSTAILLNDGPKSSEYECIYSGYVLETSVVSRAIQTRSKEDCARQCHVLGFCKTFAYSPRVMPRFNCQLSSVSALRIKDRVQDVHGDICQIGNERADVRRNACSSETVGKSLNDGLCHKQQCAGYRHYSNSFRDSLRVRDVSECSDRCAETSYCKTFSFRHGVESSLELNCLLSSYSNFRLDATSDLLTDINWNLYRRIRNDQCGNSENDRQDYSYGRDCLDTIQSESRHRINQIRQVTTASSLSDCGNRCRTLYFCRSISYRYGGGLFDNCLLSDSRIDGFGRYNSLESKLDWTVYRMNPYCNDNGGGGGGGNRDCYEQYRREYRFDSRVVRESDRYARTLRDCERACNNARFNCQGFSFSRNSGYSNGRGDRCELVDQDPRSMSNNDLRRDIDFTIYRKRRDSRYCGNYGGGSGGSYGNLRCSRQYRRNYRFLSSNARQSYNVRDESECESRCVQERSFDCRAFAFSYNNRDNTFRNNRNCELSDRRINDGGNGGGGIFGSNTGYADDQLQSDRDWTVYERTSYSGQCSSGRYGGGGNYYDDYRNNYGNNYNDYYNNNNYYGNNNYNGRGLDCYQRYRRGYTLDGRDASRTTKVSSIDDCARECDRTRGGSTRGRGCSSFAIQNDAGAGSASVGLGFGGSYGQERQCILAEYGGLSENDLRRDENYDVWEYRGGGNCRIYRNDNNNRKISVSGVRCNGGTVFDERDKYWYCETNDRDYEYCCSPHSSCGYSKGYEEPWCYVGDKRSERWRPCDRSLVIDVGILRDGRAQVSREIIHSSEPNVSRRAPDKYRSNWYSRVNQRSQQGNRYSKNTFRNQQQNREPNPNNRPPFLTAAATSSNISEAVVKFGF